jgi:signal transduction histidine kinase
MVAPNCGQNEPASSVSSRLAMWALSVVVVIAAVIVAAVVWEIGRREWHQTLDLWDKRLSASTSHTKQMIEAWLRERRADCEVVASFPSVAAILADHSDGHTHDQDLPSHLGGILERIVAAYGYDSLFLIGPSGRVITQAGDKSPPPKDVIGSGQLAIERGALRVDDVVSDSGWRVAVSSPVRAPGGGKGETLGAVTIVSNLAAFIGPVLAGSRGHSLAIVTSLVRKVGDRVMLLSSPPDGDGGAVSVMASSEIAQRALARESVCGEFLDHRGIRVLAALRHIEGTDWGLITKVDRDEAIAEFRGDARQTAVAGALVVLVLAALILGVRRAEHIRSLRTALALRTESESRIQRLNEELEQRVRKRTAALEAANRELEAFSYSVSHDLRAPLRHVEGFTKLLAEDHGPQLPAEGQHYVERIVAGCRRMTSLIDALLLLSRVGRAPLQESPVDLDAATRAVFEELKPTMAARSVEFATRDLPTVSADPVLVRQLLTNLIGNALKFTAPQAAARVEVGSESHDGRAVFYVRDNGVGFDPRYVDKLFKAFQRLHAHNEFEGTGIGLSIVKRIVEKHGGRVWAEASPGAGATFYFTLHEE